MFGLFTVKPKYETDDEKFNKYCEEHWDDAHGYHNPKMNAHLAFRMGQKIAWEEANAQLERKRKKK